MSPQEQADFRNDNGPPKSVFEDGFRNLENLVCEADLSIKVVEGLFDAPPLRGKERDFSISFNEYETLQYAIHHAMRRAADVKHTYYALFERFRLERDASEVRS